MPRFVLRMATCLVNGTAIVLLMLDTAMSQTANVLQHGAVQQAAPAPGPSQPVAIAPARAAWLKSRCSQLVAFYDRYGVSRGENSDGPRNHTRIGASIECERTNYRTGIDTMAALLVRKAFDVPKPSTPALEPQDLEAPDITNPTAQR
jgi:hypothetical protein